MSFKISLLSLALVIGFFGLIPAGVDGAGLTNSATLLGNAGERTGLLSTLFEGGAFTIVATGLWMVLGTVFLGLAIYGGILWMTAAGNKERIEQARKIIFEAMIGLILLMSAYVIASFITTSLSS